MKVVLAFECTVDGVLPGDKKVSDFLSKHLCSCGSAILSEDYGSTDDWAIIIDSIALIKESEV